jgi:hypothetical protein
MLIRAKRPFISTREGIGNVSAGLVLDIDDAYAKNLIENGLAEEVSARPAREVPRPTSFQHPVGAKKASGSSLPAETVSQKRTVKQYAIGAKKAPVAGSLS